MPQKFSPREPFSVASTQKPYEHHDYASGIRSGSREDSNYTQVMQAYRNTMTQAIETNKLAQQKRHENVIHRIEQLASSHAGTTPSLASERTP